MTISRAGGQHKELTRHSKCDSNLELRCFITVSNRRTSSLRRRGWAHQKCFCGPYISYLPCRIKSSGAVSRRKHMKCSLRGTLQKYTLFLQRDTANASLNRTDSSQDTDISRIDSSPARCTLLLKHRKSGSRHPHWRCTSESLHPPGSSILAECHEDIVKVLLD